SEAMTTSDPSREAIKGRGASWNPQNRFEKLEYVLDEDASPNDDEPAPLPRTLFLRDPTRTILAHNDSPDVGFDTSINPYRGCEHGCIYCFARPTHEFLGFSAGLEFETKILVKEDAPELLREELMSRKYEPRMIAISGVTDPYQPIERKLEITRRCLAVLAEFRNPVGIITKNHLVTRDIDILQELAAQNAVSVHISVTTLDPRLANLMEPRASRPELRIAAIEALSKAGIPAGVMVAPVVPAITDHEMPAILTAAANAGATSAGFVVLRLPWAVAPLFEKWLEEHYPDRKEKVMNRVRDLREGKLYDPQWGVRQRRQRDLRGPDRIDVRSDVPPPAPQREKVRPAGFRFSQTDDAR
ncbi:MAG TPA: PA0069 family radical SAM protein, partial [Thermoanaerobaculia bacterium]|nr:PA0069 family radical SAM protein [Thermoanaerobaculia bacterium]